MKKKLGALLLATVCAFSTAATACGGPGGPGGPNGGGDEDIYNVASSTKTRISVAVGDGGVGTKWIDEAAERFAKLKKDESYESGKTGIFVDVQPSSNIDLTAAAQSSNNILFSERIYDASTLAQSNQVLNVTDVVTDTSRAGGSLESAINPQMRDFCKGFDGNYYAFPHYEFFGGLSYDVDVFNNCNAWFAAENETATVTHNSKFGSAKLVANASAKKSKGPDGKANTEDDGMPCSLEELLILFDYFKNKTEYAPVTMTGKYVDYSNYLLVSLWASLAGTEQMTNYYNCEGEIEVVDGYTNENLFPGIDYIKKPNVKTVNMKADGSDGYYGSVMSAKYYAMAILEIIYKEGFFSSDSSTDTIDHWNAQRGLIFNPIDTNYSKCAMLIEASYWYNEASDAGSFDLYKTMSGDTQERNIRMMRLPSCYYTKDLEPTTNTLLDIGQGIGVISANVAGDAGLTRACKEFMAFLYTTEELKAFTACTGVSRPLNYEMSAEQMANVSGFQRDVWNYSHVTGDVVYYSGTTEAFKRAKRYLCLNLSLPNRPVYNNVTRYDFLGPFKQGANTQGMFESNKYSAVTWAQIIG